MNEQDAAGDLAKARQRDKKDREAKAVGKAAGKAAGVAAGGAATAAAGPIAGAVAGKAASFAAEKTAGFLWKNRNKIIIGAVILAFLSFIFWLVVAVCLVTAPLTAIDQLIGTSIGPCSGAL